MTIEPALIDFTIYQGVTFRERIQWLDQTHTPVDLTGYTARFEASYYYGYTPFLVLTPETGGITLGADGFIDLYIDPATTAAITQDYALYNLHLLAGDGKTAYHFAYGRLFIVKD